MLNKEQSVQVSDTSKVDSSNTAGNQNKIKLPAPIHHTLNECLVAAFFLYPHSFLTDGKYV
jgi:hypothetical protein